MLVGRVVLVGQDMVGQVVLVGQVAAPPVGLVELVELVRPALLAMVVMPGMFCWVDLAGLPTILTRIHVMGLV